MAAAILAVVTATIPTAAQQAKETAQGGQSKESNGVACVSMADAPPRGCRWWTATKGTFSLLAEHRDE